MDSYQKTQLRTLALDFICKVRPPGDVIDNANTVYQWLAADALAEEQAVAAEEILRKHRSVEAIKQDVGGNNIV